MFNILKKYPDNHTLGPLLITIGPNCSGKTEFINSLGENVREFSNENIHGLYERIPISLAAAVWRDKITGEVIQALKNKNSSGKPLMERLKEQKESEVVYLALYFARMMTLDELVVKLHKILPTAEYFDSFVEVIAGIKAMLKSKTIDIFVPEVVESGVVGLVTAVKAAIKTEPGVICWGNNNVEPVYYREILNTAYKYKRVVRFVRWGQELPSCSLKDLFKRSILQFLKTGRYVESFEIAKNWAKAELFFKECGSATHNDIVKVSGYFLDINGTLAPLSQESNKRRVSLVKFDSTKWSDWTNVGRVYNLRKKLTTVTSKASGLLRSNSNAPSATPSVDGDGSVVSERSDVPGGRSKRPSVTPVSETEEEQQEQQQEEEEEEDFDVSMLSLTLPSASIDAADTVWRGSATAALGGPAAGVPPPPPPRPASALTARSTISPTAAAAAAAASPAAAASVSDPVSPDTLTKENSQAMWDSFYENLDANKLLGVFGTTETRELPEQQNNSGATSNTETDTLAAQLDLFSYFGYKESLAESTTAATAASQEPKKEALPTAPPSSNDPGEELAIRHSTAVKGSDGGWCIIFNFQTLFSM